GDRGQGPRRAGLGVPRRPGRVAGGGADRSRGRRRPLRGRRRPRAARQRARRLPVRLVTARRGTLAPMLSIPEAQAALQKLGYYDGEVDGDYEGANWRDDLRRFQRDYPACGEADGWFGAKTDHVLAPIAQALQRT